MEYFAQGYTLPMPWPDYPPIFRYGDGDEPPDDVMHSVCDPQLPEPGQVWGGVVEQSGEWLEQARGAGGLGWK